MIVVNARFLTQKVTGVQRFAIEICKLLSKFDLNIEFVSPSNIIDNITAKDLNVKTIGINKGHLWEKIDLPLYLFRKGTPLLINLCNTAPLFYKNQINTLHDVAFMHNPDWFTKRFSLLYKLLMPNLLKYSKKVITVSNFSKSEISSYYNLNLSKINVIYNGVNHLKDSVNANNMTKFKLYGDFILLVGSVEPRKNLDFFINAFINSKLADTHNLVIVGGENKLFNYSNSLARVSTKGANKLYFTGYLSDDELSSLYSCAKFFAYPSLYEGFGIPPLEAMYFGCPVITSNRSSLPEVCGDAALYFDPENLITLSDLLNEIYLGKINADKLRNLGYERVKKFSWEKSALKLVEVINSIII